jgi:hypothetical protein
LLWVSAGWISLALQLRPSLREKVDNDTFLVRPLALWSAASAAALWVFYLRFPFMCSRYLLDFAPAFGAAMLAAVIMLQNVMPARHPLRVYFTLAVYMLFGFWWSWQIVSAEFERSFQPAPVNYGRLTSKMSERDAAYQTLPDAYEIGTKFFRFGVGYNGAGWNTVTGETKAAVAIFVHDVEFLELTVAPGNGQNLNRQDYNTIRAKIGLEQLPLESVRKTSDGQLLRFRGPRRRAYQSGIEVAFIAFMSTDELSEDDSRFRLLRARWRGGHVEVPPE